MLFEKKMLILVGRGKGVVFIEKNGLGVKFALRTFGVTNASGLKIGVITKTAVFVRDLPDGGDPSSVFYLDGADLSDMHVAVFDTDIVLYGTTARTRMWESNLMDLFARHMRPLALDRNGLPELPPIIERPKVLPMPNGNGIVQTSDRLYGDEALAESDFYTPFDISTRLAAVDGFLDTPRVLDGISPRIVPPPDISARDIPLRETTAVADGGTSESVGDRAVSADAGEYAQPVSYDDTSSEQETAEHAKSNHDNFVAAENADGVPSAETDGHRARAVEPERSDSSSSDCDDASTGDNGGAGENDEAREEVYAETMAVNENASIENERRDTPDTVKESAATDAAVADVRREPWELTALWLKSRSQRTAKVKIEKVPRPSVRESVPKLREVAFFERCRTDIEKLFAVAPHDDELKALLPDLDWIRVEFDGNIVSVGRSGNVLLCYAVSGSYEKISPLGEEAQWLPKNKTVPTGKGYWLIFQDLASGEIVTGN